MLWGIDTICISGKKLSLSLFYCDKTPWQKQLIGKCFIWAHCSRGFESMTVMVGSMAAGRLFPGAVAKSSHLDLQVQSKENQLGVPWALETSKPAATRPHLLVLPKHSTSWGWNIQTYEPRGAILLQTTTEILTLLVYIKRCVVY